ncbi:hypothetical protein [Streptomyces sp. ZEA17I]|uniref:hypothetical protein n=1 Tax=Streptomyces sp. ZEA17I TaxID=2202516 RepID=UPI001C63C0C3|nr:hypothetical protein [Streptomyces sp. ZEA17I]
MLDAVTWWGFLTLLSVGRRPTDASWAPVSGATAISPVCSLTSLGFGGVAANATADEVSIFKNGMAELLESGPATFTEPQRLHEDRRRKIASQEILRVAVLLYLCDSWGGNLRRTT